MNVVDRRIHKTRGLTARACYNPEKEKKKKKKKKKKEEKKQQDNRRDNSGIKFICGIS